jgi:hypothetical protein
MFCLPVPMLRNTPTGDIFDFGFELEFFFSLVCLKYVTAVYIVSLPDAFLAAIQCSIYCKYIALFS